MYVSCVIYDTVISTPKHKFSNKLTSVAYKQSMWSCKERILKVRLRLLGLKVGANLSILAYKETVA
jgi:hypothetical protein